MSHDTVAHRLVRPLVRPLVGTPVRPNHLTLLRFVTGVAAAAAFAKGGQGPVALGAAISWCPACLTVPTAFWPG